MENSNQIFTQEKRIKKAKNTLVQFVTLEEKQSYFNIVEKNGTIKYIGKITKQDSLNEYCTCPDHFHRNTENYKNEHGFCLQCKHMIQAKTLRGWL